MKKFILFLSCLAMMIPGVALAESYSFSVLENNTTLDVTDQLKLEVATTGNGDVSFTFTNVGTVQSTITEIYFDTNPNDLLDWSSASIENSSGVNYSSVGVIEDNSTSPVKPSNLPGATTIGFVADWGADPKKDVSNGIDNYTGSVGSILEYVTIIFSLKSEQSFEDILKALTDGYILIGLHVQNFADGESETYVNDPSPVPEPATMFLFGTGIAGLAGVARRKRI